MSVGFTTDEAKTMVCIAKWESAFKPTAINVNPNGSVDYGLYQINSKWWLDKGKKGCSQTREELLTPEGNVACARFVYKQLGFKAWIAYKIRAECNPKLEKDLHIKDLYPNYKGL